MGERPNSVKLELDRFQNWLESKHEGWNRQARYCAGKAWQARANLAAEEVRELVEALKDIAYSALTGQESGRIARNALAKHPEFNDE